MKQLMFFCSILSVLLLSANRAFAFNFGFVRAPDWMDPYLGGLVVVTVVFWLGLAATKPSGVPSKQVRYVKISPTANFFYLGMAFFFAIMMVMLFTGMALRRYAEWTSAA
ncbi:hypothetical protein [Mesorhizobium sp.]|uniref:hypothetical protein n=1 Tax=Mesorhizobium sp. TaxID=1871066 RepID=UPI000FE67E23|nr:hypothetical protein [Mesorhizobium sp.]RWC32623.1 MAG: hypothetical protein EOS27_05865 [Mesorhizobium sp.]TIX25178.1 MAG: hypothetical protein E5V35_15515 [Mesorhizobium sp.]